MVLHSGRIVAVEAALAGLAVAAVAGTPVAWLLAVPTAAGLLTLGLGRVRHRPLTAWCTVALRYLTRTRRRRRSADPLAFAAPAALLSEAALSGKATPLSNTTLGNTALPGNTALLGNTALPSNAAPSGGRAGLVEDAGGLVAVLALGDPNALIGEALPLPAPADLLPDPAPDTPRLCAQLLVASVPAPASRSSTGLVAASYRQLTEGWVPARCRALLAIRACRDDPLWTEERLRPALSSAVRRIRHRLEQDQIPSRVLDPEALAGILTELAHLDATQPAWEGWRELHTGDLHQASVLLNPRSKGQADLRAQLVPRLLCLPATAVAVAVTASQTTTRASRDRAAPIGGHPVQGQLVVRVTAPGATALTGVLAALHRLVQASGAIAEDLSGEQVEGLAATLPLATLRWPKAQPGNGHGQPDQARVPVAVLPPSGLMIGRNRRGEPVTIQLARPEPTRAVLAGGVRAAAVFAARALALGIHVVVQTGRPGTWEVYLRGVSRPGDPVSLVPPGRPIVGPPAGPLAPQLLVLDADASVSGPPAPASAWRTILVVREELREDDVETLTRADVVILQPLSAEEAALAGRALHLDQIQEWLARIRSDMVGVASRGRVRWAQLCATPIERQVIGAPERMRAGSTVSG